jgi:hypothetical protein
MGGTCRARGNARCFPPPLRTSWCNRQHSFLSSGTFRAQTSDQKPVVLVQNSRGFRQPIQSSAGIIFLTTYRNGFLPILCRFTVVRRYTTNTMSNRSFSCYVNSNVISAEPESRKMEERKPALAYVPRLLLIEIFVPLDRTRLNIVSLSLPVTSLLLFLNVYILIARRPVFVALRSVAIQIRNVSLEQAGTFLLPPLMPQGCRAGGGGWEQTPVLVLLLTHPPPSPPLQCSGGDV